jgi:hypothetical protein
MITFVCVAVVAMFTTWALIDIYFYSVLFDGVRGKAEQWEQSHKRRLRILGYGLSCRYCLSHWTAAVVLLLLLLLPNHIAASLTIFEAILLIPIVARLSVVLRENILPPVVEPLRDPEDEIYDEICDETSVVIENQPREILRG